MGQDKLKRSSTRLSTVGIVVSDWTYYKKVKESQTSLKSITFMTWDFGGQVGLPIACTSVLFCVVSFPYNAGWFLLHSYSVHTCTRTHSHAHTHTHTSRTHTRNTHAHTHTYTCTTHAHTTPMHTPTHTYTPCTHPHRRSTMLHTSVSSPGVPSTWWCGTSPMGCGEQRN